MEDPVEVFSAEPAGYLQTEYASGTTTNYTLRRGNEYVSCDEVLILETDEESLEDTFEEWKEMAESNEEGYKYWTV